MKVKSALMTTLVAILISVGACASSQRGSASQPTSIEVSINEFMNTNHITKEVQVPVDSLLIVTLGSNPTTGFQWQESAQIIDQTVLKRTDHKYIAPEAQGNVPPTPGTGGEEVWTFRACNKGATTVSLEYSRPWEGGEKGALTFKLTVTVK